LPKIFAMILCRNCETLLPLTFEKIPTHYFDRIFVSDDASTDGSVLKASKLGLEVTHSKNRGYGGNVKNGLKFAFDEGADYVVEIHGDGAQFDPAATLLAIPHIKNGDDFIIGSRFINRKEAIALGMPLARFVANTVLSQIDHAVLRLPFTEYHTGFRIYGPAFKNINFAGYSNNYLFSFEVIASAAFLKLKCAEVAVKCDYSAAHTSVGYLDSTLYAIRHFKTLIDFLLAKYFRIFIGIFKNV